MKVTVKLSSANQIINRTGFNKGGRVQQFWTTSVSRHLAPYLPFANANSVGMALTRGTNYKTGLIEVVLPYARYLYYGKVMIGPAPKKVTNKDLQYTRQARPMAGPYWERRMLSENKKTLMKELYKFVGKSGVR